MSEEKKEAISRDRNCTAGCKTLHIRKPYKGWKQPTLFNEYLKNIGINYYFGYFDICQILKYTKCLDELLGIEDSEDDDQPLSVIESQGVEEGEEEESVVSLEEDSPICEWVEEDDNGEEIECTDLKAPNCNFCLKHNEDDKIFRQMIEYYAKDVLGLIDKALIKQMSKELPGWKIHLEEDLRLSKYMLGKTIKEQAKQNKKIEEIVQYLYDLE